MSSYMTSFLTNDAKSQKIHIVQLGEIKTTTTITTVVSLRTRSPCTQEIHLEAPQVTSTGDVYSSYVTKPPKTPKYCS